MMASEDEEERPVELDDISVSINSAKKDFASTFQRV